MHDAGAVAVPALGPEYQRAVRRSGVRRRLVRHPERTGADLVGVVGIGNAVAGSGLRAGLGRRRGHGRALSSEMSGGVERREGSTIRAGWETPGGGVSWWCWHGKE